MLKRAAAISSSSSFETMPTHARICMYIYIYIYIRVHDFHAFTRVCVCARAQPTLMHVHVQTTGRGCASFCDHRARPAV